MKFIDNIINKFGHDKIIHYFVAAYLTSIGANFGLLGIIIFPIIIMILGLIKDLFLDDFFDKKDVLANLYGCITATIINLLLWIF